MSEHLKIQAGGVERLREFMARIAGETYPEPLCEMHTGLTKAAMERVFEMINAEHRTLSVLDVGCGQGPALEMFRQFGAVACGIALNEEDVKVCWEKGFAVHRMDQNDLAFEDGWFDLVWARHVLEHSVAPLWTLTEFWRVLKAGGWLYVEVPGPGTKCLHETNKNHYSVFGDTAWYCLLGKAGFQVVEGWRTNLQTQAGPDVYFSFIARKP